MTPAAAAAPPMFRVLLDGLIGGLGVALLGVFFAVQRDPALAALQLPMLVLAVVLLLVSGVRAGLALPPLRTARAAFLRMGLLWCGVLLLSGLYFSIGLTLGVQLLQRAPL